VLGLIVVVPCRASLFDGGCIGDSQRRLFIEEKRKDIAYSQISQIYRLFALKRKFGKCQRKDVGERRQRWGALVVCMLVTTTLEVSLKSKKA
jgi:hypothetical protein